STACAYIASPSFPTRRSSDLLDGFRQVNGLLATSAIQTRTLSTGGAAILPLGMRANVTYRLTRGIVWTLRTDEQVPIGTRTRDRSEEHTSELQSRVDLVCRLL